jgi:hypothetical protein
VDNVPLGAVGESRWTLTTIIVVNVHLALADVASGTLTTTEFRRIEGTDGVAVAVG